MSDDVIGDRIRQIIADKLNLEDISKLTDNAHLVDDLGADSLEQADILFAIEDEYNLNPPEGEETPLYRIGEIVSYFKGLIGEQQ